MNRIFGTLSAISTNDVFAGLSSIQIIIFFVCVGLALFVGLFLGACIFFPAGVKTCINQIRRKKAKILASGENKQLEELGLGESTHKISAQNLNLSDKDYSIDDSDIIDEDDLVEDEAFDVKDGDKSLNTSDVNTIFFGDKDYVALVEKRKREVPVIGRNYLVNKINAMDVVSRDIDIVIHYPTEDTPYVRVTAGDCTYLYIFVMKKVMKIFLRMHSVTFESTKRKVGNVIAPAPTFGEDWYSLMVSDFPQARAIVTNVAKLSYLYTAQTEFDIVGGVVTRKGVDYENRVFKCADDYNPYEDEEFIELVNGLHSKYNLDYYGKSDGCAMARKLTGKEPVSVMEFVGNRPAIFKAGETMFGILFENYGVSKFIFRNSEKYFENLKTKHRYVKESPFPKSEDWKWYSILIDSTYTKKEMKQIIQDSYNYVIAYNEKHLLDSDVDVDINV